MCWFWGSAGCCLRISTAVQNDEAELARFLSAGRAASLDENFVDLPFLLVLVASGDLILVWHRLRFSLCDVVKLRGLVTMMWCEVRV